VTSFAVHELALARVDARALGNALFGLWRLDPAIGSLSPRARRGGGDLGAPTFLRRLFGAILRCALTSHLSESLSVSTYL
jgi:hypothetical protein